MQYLQAIGTQRDTVLFLKMRAVIWLCFLVVPTQCTRLVHRPRWAPRSRTIAMSQYPVLSKLQGDWRGSMRYAAGDELALAPFTLTGTMCVKIEGADCVIESSVVLPNGQERAVVMSADGSAQEGGQLGVTDFV